jgi:serine/threonine protein kinase
MAPEQACGLAVDHRVDVYAVGVIMYQLLTGQLPFPGQNMRQVQAAILSEDARPMRSIVEDGDISEELEQLVAMAMHRDITQRLGDMASLAVAILEVPIRDEARPVARATGAAPTSSPSLLYAVTQLASAPEAAHGPRGPALPVPVALSATTRIAAPWSWRVWGLVLLAVGLGVVAAQAMR